MIRHEHFNTYMKWKFKSLRIWPSEKSIDREFRLRHFWKFFWDNNQKSFWDSRQMFTLNHSVHHNVIAEKSISKISGIGYGLGLPAVKIRVDTNRYLAPVFFCRRIIAREMERSCRTASDSSIQKIL